MNGVQLCWTPFLFNMRITLLISALFFWACSKNPTPAPTLYTNSTKSSGIDFRNDLVYTDQLNPYAYRNFYNGAGVGIGRH
ncbi:MAG: hypothetical protein U5K54_24000 [Cytophagales bacterium]|nr:hypothetical protein [Cytophagales bacterium]